MENFIIDVHGNRARPRKRGVVIGLTDQHGNWPTRTKVSHPYSYEPICQFLRTDVHANNSAYHDRMQMWDGEKFDRASKAHLPNGYHNMSNARRVEPFLRDYYEDPNLILVCIEEHCNASNGFPCFYFAFYQKKHDKNPK